MDKKIVVSGLLVAALFVPVTTTADDSSSSHPVAVVKDSIITTKIKTKLAAEKLNTLAHIEVSTDRSGVVYLSGRVDTRVQADRAVSIARDTRGVRSVHSSIMVGTN